MIPHPTGHCLLVGLLDNLGKGAAGVAIQNLNLMLGIDETRGLPA
jgi:N-acetyl-gamma-glutamyl-phosphate reductase